jgi:hypothetical protein
LPPSQALTADLPCALQRWPAEHHPCPNSPAVALGAAGPPARRALHSGVGPGAPSDLAWSVVSAPIRTLGRYGVAELAGHGLTERLDRVPTGSSASVRGNHSGGARSGHVQAVVRFRFSVHAGVARSLIGVGHAPGWDRPGCGSHVGQRRGGRALSLTLRSDLTLTTIPSSLRQLRD